MSIFCNFSNFKLTVVLCPTDYLMLFNLKYSICVMCTPRLCAKGRFRSVHWWRFIVWSLSCRVLILIKHSPRCSFLEYRIVQVTNWNGFGLDRTISRPKASYWSSEKKETCKTKGKIKQKREKLGSNRPADAIQKIADVFKNSVRITSD